MCLISFSSLNVPLAIFTPVTSELWRLDLKLVARDEKLTFLSVEFSVVVGSGLICVRFVLHYLLTYSMVQSPSWEANWFAASQEIPHISRNPKVHYRTHKRPPPVSILGQPNPVHIPTSHLLEIHSNIIHPYTPRFPHWSLSFSSPHQTPVHASPLSYAYYMPRPCYSSRFKITEEYWVSNTDLLSHYYL